VVVIKKKKKNSAQQKIISFTHQSLKKALYTFHRRASIERYSKLFKKNVITPHLINQIKSIITRLFIFLTKKYVKSNRAKTIFRKQKVSSSIF